MESQARKQLQLQGPKPAALMVNKNSTKIKKHLSHQNRSPVIVHLRSPKVIHVGPEEFMSLVQQLTGNPKSAAVVGSRSQSHHGSSMKETHQRINTSTVDTMDENQMQGFFGSIGPAGLSVDLQALMHFVDFV